MVVHRASERGCRRFHRDFHFDYLPQYTWVPFTVNETGALRLPSHCVPPSPAPPLAPATVKTADDGMEGHSISLDKRCVSEAAAGHNITEFTLVLSHLWQKIFFRLCLRLSWLSCHRISAATATAATTFLLPCSTANICRVHRKLVPPHPGRLCKLGTQNWNRGMLRESRICATSRASLLFAEGNMVQCTYLI